MMHNKHPKAWWLELRKFIITPVGSAGGQVSSGKDVCLGLALPSRLAEVALIHMYFMCLPWVCAVCLAIVQAQEICEWWQCFSSHYFSTSANITLAKASHLVKPKLYLWYGQIKSNINRAEKEHLPQKSRERMIDQIVSLKQLEAVSLL